MTYNRFSFFFYLLKPKMNKYNAQCCFTFIVKIVLPLPVIFILQNIGLNGSLSAQGPQYLCWDYCIYFFLKKQTESLTHEALKSI